MSSPPLPATMPALVAVGGAAVVESRALPVPRAGEVLVRVTGSAVNRADTLQRRGLYDPPPGVTDVLGLELTGVVAALGPPAPPGAPPALPGVAAVGARVMALVAGGGNAGYAAVPACHLLPVPPAWTTAVASAVPETFLTAFQLLHLVAAVRPGDIVLVHAAGSGVGTAAVQLARLAGATVIAVAGTDAKLAVAKSLGAAAGVNYKADPDGWPAAVLAATPGARGVDVILDPVGGSFWAGNAHVLALDGTWVLYGSLGGSKVEGALFAALMRKRARLLATTLRGRSLEYKAALVARFAADALPALARGEVAPVVDSAFALADGAAAHARMESNESTGKILLTLPGDE